MKNLTLKSVLYLFFITALLLGGCKGDQGDPGPAGKDGTNGTNGTNGKDGVDGTNGTNGTNGKDGTNGTNGKDGTNGTNGTDGKDGADGTNGTNGLGFDEAIKYGNISVNLTGTRPDEIAFTKSLNFKFAGSSLCYSQIVIDGETGDSRSTVQRYLLFDNITHTSDNYTSIRLQTNSQGNPFLDMNFTADITTNDFKYFTLDDYYTSYNQYYYDGESYYYDTNFSDYSLTNYSYNEVTGQLRYNFRFVVLADYNSTGFPLTVSGTVNAIVYQPIGNENCGVEGRKRAILGKVPKAVMKDLPH